MKSLTPARIATLALALVGSTALLLVTSGGRAEAAPAPTVSAVAPALGPSAGGTSITITGTGFVSGATVTIGGTAATGVTVVSATSITATTPAGTPGGATVTVRNSDGQAANVGGGFTFQYPVPTVTAIAPATGTSDGGTAITVTGTGFRAGATVRIGGIANATSVVVASGTSITAVTPAGLVGANAVTVTNTDGQSGTLAAGFTYTAAAAPHVTSVAPTSGTVAGGTILTITGTGFVTGATITIGGIAATSVTVVNATTITATAPAASTSGAATIAVTNPDTQSGSLASGYTYNPLPAPTVSAVTPNTGTTSGGTSVSITGTGFLANATVSVGGAAATGVTVVSSTAITATVPARPAGAVAVTVTNYDGLSGSNATGYTYKANAAPTVTAVAAATGPVAGNTSVTITGTNFQTGATVRFGNNASSSVTVAGTTAILAVTPAGTAGVAPIVVTNPDGQTAVLSSGFTYTVTPPPAITAASPAKGLVGTLVTITGTGFTTGATVMFGPFTAQSPVVTATSITVMAPPSVGGGVPIIVTNPDGQVATLANGFSYEATGTATATGTPNVAEDPPAGGMAFVVAGTNDLQALITAQKFKVVAAFAFDVPTQVWRTYVVGAPQNSLTTIAATDIIVLRK